MLSSVIIKHSLDAQKIIDELKSKGHFVESKVIETDKHTAESCVNLKADVVYLEAEDGFSTLTEVTTKLGWKKFRLFAFDLTDGEDSVKFYICYGENCFNAFPVYIFNGNFTLDKFEKFM